MVVVNMPGPVLAEAVRYSRHNGSPEEEKRGYLQCDEGVVVDSANQVCVVLQGIRGYEGCPHGAEGGGAYMSGRNPHPHPPPTPGPRHPYQLATMGNSQYGRQWHPEMVFAKGSRKWFT